MKKLIILTIIIHMSFLLSGQIINIPNDYTTIQQGINAAAEGDTVLVDIGIYVENINFSGKNITVASYLLTTLDTTYISQTVIKGNPDSLEVVLFENDEDSTAVLCGFTIMNGTTGIVCKYASPTLKYLTIKSNLVNGGIYLRGSNSTIQNVDILDNIKVGGDFMGHGMLGAGLLLDNSSPTLDHVNIKYNSVLKTVYFANGGGISCCDSSFPSLNYVNITNNLAQGFGGGIYCDETSKVLFDSIALCNVFYNEALVGSDIYSCSIEGFDIKLDTFTVAVPTDFYLETLNQNLICQAQNYKRTLITDDLYVSPNGDDNNSGLSSDDPLKTIYKAFSMIIADSSNPVNINLAGGYYSSTTNNEKFPLNVPDYVNLIGDSSTTTFLSPMTNASVLILINNAQNCLDNFWIMNGNNEDQIGGGITTIYSHSCLKNLKITNNYGGGYFNHIGGGGAYFLNSYAVLDNIHLSNNSCNAWGGGINCKSSVLDINHSLIDFNQAENNGGGIYSQNSELDIKNSIVSNNNSYFGGGGINLDTSSIIAKNVLICNNSTVGLPDKFPLRGGGGIQQDNSSGSYVNVSLINNSVTGSNKGGGIICISSDPVFTNSIIWGNMPQQIFFHDLFDPNSVTLSYSDVEGGADSIYTNNNGNVNWLEGNFNINPLFESSGEYMFSLTDDSPCIDAGTPDTNGLSLPIDDLIGNLRVWDGDGNGIAIIDMGAYEFGSVPVNVKNPIVLKYNVQTRIKINPNPFNQSITIELELNVKSKVSLSIYNQQGVYIATIFEGEKKNGIHKLMWHSDNLPSGIYFIELRTDEGIMTKKVIKI